MKFKKFDQPSSEGGGLYLKIVEDVPVFVICRGDIYDYFVLWNEGKSSVVMEGTPGAKLRFKVNAVVNENGRLVAKIWEFGRMVYDQLVKAQALIENIDDTLTLETTRLQIIRTGQKLDTDYQVNPILKAAGRLTPKELHEIEALDLNILDKNAAPRAEEPMPTAEDEPWQGY